MENQNNIKIFVLSQCPHCNKNIYLSESFSPPTFHKIYKEEDIKEAKLLLKERIIKEGIKDFARAIVWIDDENNIITPDDIENIIQQLKDNENKN